MDEIKNLVAQLAVVRGRLALTEAKAKRLKDTEKALSKELAGMKKAMADMLKET